jgi:phosphorylcholine metabolism protein LicD
MLNSTELKEDLKNIVAVTNKINLPTFLAAGTALGIYRQNDFIPGDLDVDLGIYRYNFTPIMHDTLIKELANIDCTFKGYECKAFEPKLEPNYIPYVIKFWTPIAHVNIDFWIYEERKNEYYHRGWLGYFYFLKETLDTLDEIEFAGMQLKIPHNPELYLENMYGKDWKIPKKMKKPMDYPNWSKELKNE